MGGMMGGSGMGYGGLGLLGMILNLVITIGVIVGIVLLVVWLVRRVAGGTASNAFQAGPAGGPGSAKEILQIRYARGEIDRELYQKMLADLA